MPVLIIDPFSSGSSYAELLSPTGISTYYLQTDASVIAGLAPYKEESYMQFSQDFDKNLQRLYFWAIEKDICTVLTGAESGVRIAEALKEALDTHTAPVGAVLSQKIVSRYDKYLMLAAGRAAGLNVGRFLKVSGLTSPLIPNYTDIFREDETVVIKPSISAGSVDVTLAKNYQEAIHKTRELLTKENLFGQSNVPVLIQQFHSGIEFIVDTVSFNHTHQILAVSNYDKHRIDSGHFVYDRIQWIPANHEAYGTVTEYAKAILDALDYSDGSAHIEIMLTSDGPYLIDIGFRPHGAGHPMRTFELTGNSQLHQEVTNALARERGLTPERPEYCLKSYGSIEFFSLEAPASTAPSFNFDSITDMPQVRDFTANIKTNTQYPQTRTLLDSLDLGMCFIVDSSPVGLQRVGAKVRQEFLKAFI